MRNLIVLAFFFIPFRNTAAEIKVGNNQQFQHIKEAIAFAKPTDTVFIENGLYQEGNIVITKSLHIYGEKNTILDGQGRFEILTVSTNNFSIKGITFINSGYSLAIQPKVKKVAFT